jgi:thioredoxin 2
MIRMQLCERVAAVVGYERRISFMSNIEVEQRGLLVSCPNCGQRNRMVYDRLGGIFRCGKCRRELPPPAEAIDIGSDLVFDALVSRSSLPVLVDFWAPWCGPCKMVAPEIAKMAAEGAGRFVVAKVNTETVPALASRFRITAIPTMAIFKQGIEVARQEGAMPAPGIRKFLQPWVELGKQ